MCGIAGIAGGGADGLAQRVRNMTARLAHRGPNGEGSYASPSGCCLLGHRRLSVIDVSSASSQPMLSHDGRFALVYNGELYNFREIREQLRAEGATFRTTGDTEVVLEALVRHGREALKRFNGMFALGLWDNLAGELLLARDRFGQKPLYFAQADGMLAFASEIRALLESGLVERRMDLNSLRGFLRYGSVPGPGTLIEGMRSLDPGTCLTWRPGGEGSHEKYWEPSREQRVYSPEALREVLSGAVERHLLSDVPIGVFLSGGLDSACIAALAAIRKPGETRTFTLVFPNEPSQGEAAEARETARHLYTVHTEVAVSADFIREHLDAALRSQDQPSGDGLNTWLVARAARGSGMTVALSGLGADELFGGYGTFNKVHRLARLRTATGPLSGLLSGAAEMVSAASPRKAGRIADLLRAPQGLLEACLVRRSVLSGAQIRRLAPGVAEAGWMPGLLPDRIARLSARIDGRDAEVAVALLELDLYMGDTLLRDADTMGMAHALEIRMPFLDTVVADAALALPPAARRPAPRPKHALAAAVSSLLPAALPSRAKRGFTLPLSDWMRGPLRSKVQSGLESLASGNSLFDPVAIGAFWDEFLQRPERVGWYRPWSLFALSQYLERHEIRMP